MDVRRDGYWCLIGEGWCTREEAAQRGRLTGWDHLAVNNVEDLAPMEIAR